MKKYFITGLIAAIPLAVVVWLISIVINLAASIVGHYSLMTLVVGILIAILALFGTGVLLVHLPFVTRTKEWVEQQIIDRTPLVKSVYKFSKDVAENALEEKVYDKVVRVYPFGRENAGMIGLLTNEKHGCVFVPSSPNPASGQTYNHVEYDILEDWTVDDVVKYDVSVGLSCKEF